MACGTSEDHLSPSRPARAGHLIWVARSPLRGIVVRGGRGRAGAYARSMDRGGTDRRNRATPSDLPGEMISTPSMETAVHEVKALGLDEATFRAFYDDALPRVYGYLLHRCGGVVAVAEDLTQETFMAAVVELRRGRTVGAALPWVYGIARHKLIDHYRRQERAERLAGGASHALADATEATGESAERGDALLGALASLPASQRAALVLRHADGYSVPEVAEALGRSVEAVESLLVRARIAFRRGYREASR